MRIDTPSSILCRGCLAAILFWLLPLWCGAQTLEEYFVTNMKSQLQIPKSTREALLESVRSGSGNSLQTHSGVVSVLEYDENNLIKVQTSKVGFFALKRWEADGKPTFGLSWWVCDRFCDGTVKYAVADSSPSVPQGMLTLSDFCHEDSLSVRGFSKAEFDSQFEIEFIHYEFTRSDTVWAYNQTAEYLDLERRRRWESVWAGNALPLKLMDGQFTIIGKAQNRKK